MIFVDIYLLKCKPILVGILYRSPDESVFVKYINDVFTETLYKQDCSLLRGLNINLFLDETENFSNKLYRKNGQNIFQEQLILVPTRGNNPHR